jgi:hypothetical protein
MVAAFAACGDNRELVLEGPAEVTVRALGPVEGPRAVLSDGTSPDPLAITVDPPTVAVEEGGVVQAVGPGTATVTAAWSGKTVTWSVKVDPPVSLRIVDPPATLVVGQRQPLHVEARMGTKNVDPGEILWASSTPDVLELSPGGEALAKSPGTAYATVQRGESEAMVEIVVVAGSL